MRRTRSAEPSEIFAPDLLRGHVALVTGGERAPRPRRRPARPGGQYFAAAEVITPKGRAAAQRLSVDGTLQLTVASV